MRNHLPNYGKLLLLAIAGLTLSHYLSAQQPSLASAQPFVSVPNQSESLSLTQVLDQIKQQYQVTFGYQEDLVREKKVYTTTWKGKSLEKVLRQVLKPHGLEFKRLDAVHYVIRPRRQPQPTTLERQSVNTPTPARHLAAPMQRLPRRPPSTETARPPVEQTISGQVIDGETNEPLPGVNILAKGTSTGTVTDVDGNYQLTVADEVTTLVFSSIGYETVEEMINGRSAINVNLAPDIQSLSEVVVVGYGTTQKKDLTGAVAAVSAETIENRQAIQLSDALQGSMAGVTVTRDGGAPGQGAQIRVRGVTSLNVNDPLVVVDGVQGLSLDDINPNDVESVTVLKDAASQAIYGARAAAGVILVTTKRGSEGQLIVNYDYEFGSNSPTELPEYVDAQTYRRLANEFSTNDGGGETFDPEVTENYNQLNAQDPDQYPNTNWQQAILSNNPTTRHRHNLALSVGSKSVSTRASMSYVTEDGIYANKDYERFTFRVNNSLQLTDFLEASFDVYYKRTNTLDPTLRTQNPIALARRYPSVFSATRTDGEWGEGKDGENPLAETAEGGQLTENFNQLNGIIGLSVKPLPGMVIRANFAPTFDFDKYNHFFTPPRIPRLGSTTEFWPRAISSLEKRQTTVTTLTAQATVAYNKTIGNHHLGILGGYEEVTTDWEQFATTSRNLGVELNGLAFGDPLLTQNEQHTSENNIRSFFGRLSYDYQSRYLVQSNFRVDGSSRFAPNLRWGFFPSLSLGWVVSEENFSLPGFISFLKLRGSYGEVGNERIGTSRINGNEFFNYYPYQGLFELVNVVFYDGSDYVSNLGVTQNFLADQFLVWETTRTTDVGLDLGFLDDRITTSIDYYRKQTEDIIITQDLPNYLGFPDNTKTNVGSIEIEGIDVELGYRHRLGELGYAINANASFINSEIIDVGGIETFLVDGGTKIHTQGAAFGEWFGYQTNGLYQTQAQIDEYGAANNAKPGDVWLVDQLTVDTNNDGLPDARDNVINGEDRVPLGTSLPTFTYGGNLSLDYKGLDFSLTFNGVGKHMQRYENVQVEPFTQSFGNVPTYVANGAWRPGNSEAQNQSAEFPRFSGASTDFNYAVSNFWLYNAAYLRVQNMTLGYALPPGLTQRASLQKVRVYVALRNFFTFEGSELLKGWDPEVDFNGHPVMKSVLLGVNVKF